MGGKESMGEQRGVHLILFASWKATASRLSPA